MKSLCTHKLHANLPNTSNQLMSKATISAPAQKNAWLVQFTIKYLWQSAIVKWKEGSLMPNFYSTISTPNMLSWLGLDSYLNRKSLPDYYYFPILGGFLRFIFDELPDGLSAGFNISKEHTRESSTLNNAPALSNSPP